MAMRLCSFLNTTGISRKVSFELCLIEYYDHRFTTLPGFDKAEGCHGQKHRQIIPVDADQLNIKCIMSTTDAKPPKIFTKTAKI